MSASEPLSTTSVATARFLEELDTLVRARYPLIYLVSWEEQRLDAIMASLAQNHGKQLYVWSVTKGLRKLSGARVVPPFENSEDPLVALAAVEKLGEPSLVVLKDLHPFLTEPKLVRALRELGQSLQKTYTTCILLSPTLTLPTELEKEVTVLDVPLPTFRDLASLLREIVGVLRKNKTAEVELRKDQAEQLVKAALGLTLHEAENAFAKAVANDQRLDAQDIQLVLEEKRQVIRKSGLLEYYPVDDTLSGVGGLDNLKNWLSQRTSAFTEAARQFGLPEPKGLLLLGVQGCGKSLTAKAIASQWSLPLLRLDMGRIFSGLIGSSEENLRRAIRVAESAAPAVLWVDEIEKGLSGIASSGSTDGGVTARVFGALLTWLQEKTAPVFVVATANRIDGLPPELLRKGRFDEIFFIDLPDVDERAQIFDIHLRRRHRDPANYDLAELARLAEGFSGAEIEQAVVAGLYEAFAEQKELESQHLHKAIRETFPLSMTLREEIERLRAWARERTRPASTVPA
ncbi:MAG: AAA family ATPase [Deltaproteobacteria bacterium]|nr:AAA family ATPase [Deltaproteobacteria bacterium]